MEFTQNSGPGAPNPLTKFGRNLNEEVEKGKIDPVIGREEEVRRIIEIISRRTKNNPVLIGEPGVGKTAIVEGLAQRIVSKDVPDNLLDKEIYELSMSSILSGASFQGQFEQRLQEIIKEVKKSDGRKILFIDEIHQLVGAGKSGPNSSMDAANILKPMMARGEVKLIGATTLGEYRKYIEKDSALERRMTKIIVREPSKQESLTIMRGLKEKWELFHGVEIHDSALVAAVEMSDRYISDRFLPDKAIDLIDEAAARVKTEMHSMPTELDTVKRQIIHLETEKAALNKETDSKSKQRLQAIENKLERAVNLEDRLNKTWKSEKAEHDKLIKLKESIEASKNKVEKFQIEGEFAKASKLLYVTVPALEKELSRLENTLLKNNKTLVRDSVTANEIGEVISRATGIPLNKIVETEKSKLLNLKQELKKRVKGQDEALEVVSKAVLRGRAGINDPSRPIGSFLFLGSTGVGKTEVAKTLAINLFDDEKALLRLDMSEYMEKHSVSKLIGAPPGYVGYDQPGALTEGVRSKPYAVILIDEIEKAHPDVLNIFLQVLDEGQLKDSQGRLANFKNTIVIMTSNIGSESLLEKKYDLAMKEVETNFKPEFLNRIDEIVQFNTLTDSVVLQIISRLLDDLTKRLANEDITVQFSSELKAKIKESGFEVRYGARPLKRYIQKFLENKLATAIIENKLKRNHKYKIDYNKETKDIIIEDEQNNKK